MILHAENCFKFEMSYTVFLGRLIQIHSLVFAANSTLSQWVGRHGFESSRVLEFSAAPLPFCLALRMSVDWKCAPYIAVLSIILFSWISSAAITRWKGLTLNLNIQLPLIWSTWSQARGPTLQHVWAWRIGSDYNCCIASKQFRVKWLVPRLSLTCQKYWKIDGSH